MKRIIFVPQLPVKLRYSEWWITELEKEFKKHYDEVIVLGKNKLVYLDNKKDNISFAPTDKAIQFEQIQINEFINLNLEQNDTLFLSDISFPGFFSNILHHKKIKNVYAFCHGTSKNAYDYFQESRDSKWLVESGHSKLFKKVFVATNYHKEKLGWKNIRIIGLPEPPFERFNNQHKENNIISVSRDGIQKRNKRLEKHIEKYFGKILRNNFDSWNDYYHFISKSKIMIITSKEETFGYQIVDSIMNNCIPIAPYKFSYPELLPKKFLYNDEKELIEKINYFLDNKNWYVPKLINKDLIDNFYHNLIKEMN
jgi:hypothetical protein